MKQSHKREAFFWVWALFLKIFAFFPPLMVFTLLGMERYGWQEFGVEFLLLLVVSAFSLLGTLMMKGLEHRKEKHKAPVKEEYEREVLRYVPKKRADASLVFHYLWYAVGLAVSIAAVAIVYGSVSGMFGIPAVLLLTLCWGRVFRLSRQSGTNLLSLAEYLITGGLYLGCFLIVLYLHHFFGYPYEIEPLGACFAFLSVSFGFLLNQANLDRTMEDMKYHKDSLPKKIRSYNALLIGGFMLLLVLGYLFRVQIVGFLAWVGQSFLYIVISLILWVSQLFPQDAPAGENDSSASSGLLPSGGESRNWDWILLVFLVAAVVFLFTPPGRRLLVRIFTFPVRLVKYLLKKLAPERVRLSTNENRYYIDQVEDLERSSQTNTDAGSRRKLRKQLKEWRATGDPVKKVRLGYKLLHRYAEQHSTTLTPADTVRETERKTEEKPFGFAFASVVPAYEEVRYGEKTPSASIVQNVSENVERVYNGKYEK